METKKWYQSWTIWFNLVMLLVTFVTQLGTILPIPVTYIAAATTVGNLALRFKTVMGIE